MVDSNKIIIGIGELVPGMLVVNLTERGSTSPFFSGERKIKSDADIARLRDSGIQTVVIDVVRGAAPKRNNATSKTTGWNSLQESQTNVSSVEFTLRESELPSEIKSEIEIVRGIKTRVISAVQSVYLERGQGVEINPAEITVLIDETLHSLTRNPSGFMHLLHTSYRSEKLMDHVFSVYGLSLFLAKKLAVSSDDLLVLGSAALFHDAGWRNLPLTLLGKRAAYTSAELQLIRTHPENGMKALLASQLPESVAQIVLEHHERCDGSGYPRGLVKNDIHFLSRIIAVADHYDERIHQLLDKPGVLPFNAMRELYLSGEAGVMDTKVVAALVAGLGVYPVTTEVILNTGERAQVIAAPTGSSVQPVVQVVLDPDGKSPTKKRTINLADKCAKLVRSIAYALDKGGVGVKSVKTVESVAAATPPNAPPRDGPNHS